MTQYVVCVNNKNYEVSLELRKIYQTLPDPKAEAHGMIQVIDESEEDYLYNKSRFVPIEVPAEAQAAFGQVVVQPSSGQT